MDCTNASAIWQEKQKEEWIRGFPRCFDNSDNRLGLGHLVLRRRPRWGHMNRRQIPLPGSILLTEPVAHGAKNTESTMTSASTEYVAVSTTENQQKAKARREKRDERTVACPSQGVSAMCRKEPRLLTGAFQSPIPGKSRSGKPHLPGEEGASRKMNGLTAAR